MPLSPTQDRAALREALSRAEEHFLLSCPDAELTDRISSGFLDAIFVYVLFSGLRRTVTTILVAWIADPRSNPFLVNFSASGWQIAFLIFVFTTYHVCAVSIYGGTPAQLMFGLKVIQTSSGKKLSFWQAFTREIVGKTLIGVASLGVPWFLAIAGSRRQVLHDRLSQSIVKNTRNAA